MGDAKYGRLFTMADVRTLMLVAHMRGFKSGREGGGRGIAERDRVIADFDAGAMTEEVEALLASMPEHKGVRPHLAFPSDEPLFLLRASDEHAEDALAGVPDGYSPDDVELRAAEDAYSRFVRWRHENPDRVRAAD